MKYTTNIIIDKPVNELVDLYNNEENIYKWMKGLTKIERLEGIPGEEGSTSMIYFETGKRKMQMKETIITKNFPEELAVTYEAKGVWNKVITRFEDADGKTNFINEQEFQFKGFRK